MLTTRVHSVYTLIRLVLSLVITFSCLFSSLVRAEVPTEQYNSILSLTKVTGDPDAQARIVHNFIESQGELLTWEQVHGLIYGMRAGENRGRATLLFLHKNLNRLDKFEDKDGFGLKVKELVILDPGSAPTNKFIEEIVGIGAGRMQPAWARYLAEKHSGANGNAATLKLYLDKVGTKLNEKEFNILSDTADTELKKEIGLYAAKVLGPEIRFSDFKGLLGLPPGPLDEVALEFLKVNHDSIDAKSAEWLTKYSKSDAVREILAQRIQENLTSLDNSHGKLVAGTVVWHEPSKQLREITRVSSDGLSFFVRPINAPGRPVEITASNKNKEEYVPTVPFIATEKLHPFAAGPTNSDAKYRTIVPGAKVNLVDGPLLEQRVVERLLSGGRLLLKNGDSLEVIDEQKIFLLDPKEVVRASAIVLSHIEKLWKEKLGTESNKLNMRMNPRATRMLNLYNAWFAAHNPNNQNTKLNYLNLLTEEQKKLSLGDMLILAFDKIAREMLENYPDLPLELKKSLLPMISQPTPEHEKLAKTPQTFLAEGLSIYEPPEQVRLETQARNLAAKLTKYLEQPGPPSERKNKLASLKSRLQMGKAQRIMDTFFNNTIPSPEALEKVTHHENFARVFPSETFFDETARILMDEYPELPVEIKQTALELMKGESNEAYKEKAGIVAEPHATDPLVFTKGQKEVSSRLWSLNQTYLNDLLNFSPRKLPVPLSPKSEKRWARFVQGITILDNFFGKSDSRQAAFTFLGEEPSEVSLEELANKLLARLIEENPDLPTSFRRKLLETMNTGSTELAEKANAPAQYVEDAPLYPKGWVNYAHLPVGKDGVIKRFVTKVKTGFLSSAEIPFLVVGMQDGRMVVVSEKAYRQARKFGGAVDIYTAPVGKTAVGTDNFMGHYYPEVPMEEIPLIDLNSVSLPKEITKHHRVYVPLEATANEATFKEFMHPHFHAKSDCAVVKKVSVSSK